MPSSAYESRRREKAKSSIGHSSSHGREHDAACHHHRPARQDYSTSSRAAATTTKSVLPEQTRESGRQHAGSKRPQLPNRSVSAPLGELQAVSELHIANMPATPQLNYDFETAHHLATSRGLDEDEAAGVVGAVRHLRPFQPQLSEPLPEINIAVVGAEGVGKSTFVQNALELPDLSPSRVAERKIPINGNLYLVRLLEIPLEEIDINDDDTFSFPDIIEDKVIPRVDGALVLYDVKDRKSVVELPEMLNAITKASVPTVLVSCKCDTAPSERQLDPNVIEENAKRTIAYINTLQVSEVSPESNKRAVLLLLNTIIQSDSQRRDRSSSARRRAKSSTVRPVSPRHPGQFGHSRASSEFTGGLRKDPRHTRHDSTIAGSNSGDRLRVPRDDDHMHSSFLLEESASEQSPASSASSISSVNTDIHLMAGSNPTSNSMSEHGATFDELVERLLAQPMSKSDLKFAAIFLALYRKFASPRQLLEGIIERFDSLEHSGIPPILKTQTQLRYVGLIEQWCGWYPGDFAHEKTRRRLRSFIGRLAELRIFAQAAREINVDLVAVQEDDDTIWGYTDTDKYVSHKRSRSSISSLGSTLIDDPTFSFGQDLSGSTLGSSSLNDYLPKFSNQMIANVEQSQRQAELLQPIPRNPITKAHWRALMEQPDEVIAKELTRMDWVMFSSVRPRDLIRHVSTPKDQKTKYRNLQHVDRMSDHFNQLAKWVENYVLLRDKPKHRALMLEKFMRIARRLREINNYNALGAIIAGVKSTSVHRLAATRELLSPTVGKDWMKLEILMSPTRSHFAYRLAWENSSGERIPYMPLHRRDLATAEEGNKTFLCGANGKDKINWKKFEIMGDVVLSMQRAQGLPYSNLGNPRAQEQVRDLVLDVKLIRDEEELYDRSVQLEPPAHAIQGTTSKLRDFFKR